MNCSVSPPFFPSRYLSPTLMLSLPHTHTHTEALVMARPSHLPESELDVATGILKIGSSQYPPQNLLGQLQ